MKVPEHIKGDGPDRKLLPNYYKLGDVNDVGSFEAFRESVKRQVDKWPNRNDINNSAMYEIAQTCSLKTYFPSTYRQLLFQQTNPKLEREETEFDYVGYTVHSIYEEIGKILYELVPNHFRARVAILPPGEVLDWHIDSNTSYACRLQIPIIGSCHWQIRRRKEIESKVLQPGEVWFTNTGFSHRVENNGTEDRVVLLVGCRFDDIKSRFSEDIISRT